MRDFAIRFLLRGLIVAGLPWIAAHFGDAVAGAVLLFPVLTLAGFTVLGLERGMGGVTEASAGAVVAVPAVAVFLIAVSLVARPGFRMEVAPA